MRLVVYTDAQELAGAEQAAATLLRELGDHVDASVLGVSGPVVDALTRARPGSTGVVVPAVRNKGDLGPIRAHLHAVRELAPDVFQANLRTSWSCQYGSLAAMLYGKARLVAFEHAPLDPGNGVQLRLKRLLARRFSAHVAASAFSAARVEEIAALRPGSVRVIPCGVEDVPLPQPSVRDSAAPVVAAVGRLVPEKGFDVFVHALARLPAVTGVLIGDGPERGSLEALASELGVGDRLRILGWQQSPRALLADVDVVVAPSRFEGFGLSIVEAMLAERPVVGARAGAIPELVADGETGMLVPGDDPVALAAAIARLVDDPELRRRMGERGRAVALERYRPDAVARMFEALYDEVLR